MSDLATLVAWAAAALIGYVYAGYPALLWLIASVRPRGIRKADVMPPVSLIISAHNEADTIAEKLRNALAQDYPSSLLEILVVSDASTDATDELVSAYARHGVRLLRMTTRGGKTVGLNAAMQGVRGEVVVFSDANILYAPTAIRRLVRSFADPEVGCVTGDSRYVTPGCGAADWQEQSYWSYERRIRACESAFGSTVGADGAIFALRRSLYTPLASDAINDLVTPLQVVAAGYRAVFEPEAIGFEPSAGSFKGEFRRKRRIVNRSWRGVMQVPTVLQPWRTGIFAWQVWSHKVLRWLVLPILVTGGAACIAAAPQGIIYQLGSVALVGSLLAAFLGLLAHGRTGALARVGHAAFYFYMVNLAAVAGVVSALAGRVETVWTPERQ